MILATIVINNRGKPRLVKFYDRYPLDTQRRIIRECYTTVSKRNDNVCNFIEETLMGRNTKLIYRHYATLYFIFIVDQTESELGIMDLIQSFVECLDKCFENVCELDLIFHSDKVHHILDEMIMGGLVLETRFQQVLPSIENMEKLEKKS
eukprot:gnl/Trimastix_PCT/1382.p1 GENE.gnl/Trimastix_PCT/1382~~gnl/Trimastix_PCT/1382.p1  ORF type:complete len:150 (+),score=43.71 gnl/Trimastix_PCT/1382:119-568(+)